MSSKSSSSSGITFAGALTILFIGLKLTHFIDWSWLWVLSPLWIGAAAVAVFCVCTLFFAGLVTGLFALLGAIFGKRRRLPKRFLR